MQETSRIVLSICLLLAILTCNRPLAAEDSIPGPRLNNGKKWRIGYYEGGPWQDYQESLRVTVKGLMDRGWIERQPLPAISLSDQPSSKPLWDWLATSVQSRYIEFVADAFWTSDWQESRRPEVREDCLQRLRGRHVDLILAMGTWAGRDLANDLHSVPTMVMSTTDAVQSGIIKSTEDSGFDHLHARCDPTRHLRQIRLFHDIFRFRTIGVVYNDQDPDGRVLSHLDKLEQIGRERGFAVITCKTPDAMKSLEVALDEYRSCVSTLAPRVETFYLSDLRGTEPDFLWETIQPLIRHKVPTWSARGSKLVERGALISVARENFDFLAPYYSSVIARIFNGTKPRDIPQIVREEMRLAVNLETARRIGYQFPPNVLKVADLVYDDIDIPVAAP